MVLNTDGTACQDIDECTYIPCLNYGTCINKKNGLFEYLHHILIMVYHCGNHSNIIDEYMYIINAKILFLQVLTAYVCRVTMVNIVNMSRHLIP